jgi:hypothetical protein
MAAELRDGNPGQAWEAHFYGRHRPYCQIEKLTSLRELPPRRVLRRRLPGEDRVGPGVRGLAWWLVPER